MNGVKSDPIYERLLGLELLNINFGQFELILWFENEASLYTTVGVAIEANDFKPVNHRLLADFLVSLLGKKITYAGPKNEKTLEIRFDEVDVIRLEDDSEQYESIVIKLEETVLVI